MPNNDTTVLSLDVGEQRVGVARGLTSIRIANPLTTLTQSATIFDDIAALMVQEGSTTIVVGLPRNLQGDDTAQTIYCRDFASELQRRTGATVLLQDEALTSKKAEAELSHRPNFQKADVDALAATYILEDYFNEMPGATNG